jgi:hypothetical protein
MTGRSRAPIIAATWLIGFGVVLFVQQALALDWSEAWPMIIVLVGAVGLVSRSLRGVHGPGALWDFTWPLVWIVVGGALLASTTGNLGTGPLELLGEWWPAAAIALGAWFIVGAFMPRPGPNEHLVVPLTDAAEAAVRIRFGAGELATTKAQPGDLVDGRFDGGVLVHRDRHGLELEQDMTFGVPWLDHASNWTVGLSGEVPLDLRIETGAARARLDLSELQVRSLDLRTGASETRVRLPRNAGATTIRAESGMASLVIEVPTGVGARIHGGMTLGSNAVDQARFPKTLEGYASPDYATAANRADIDVRGAMGSIQVVGVA